MRNAGSRISTTEKLSLIDRYWTPRIVGEVNGHFVKLAKLKGEFVLHQHDDEDELFFVLKGRLRIVLESGEIVLNEGELTVIPRGTRHLPIADEEVHVLLFELKSTVNTGDVVNDLTTESSWI